MSGHHISSAKFLWGIGITLLALTVVTVAVTWIQIPDPWNVIIAVSIAVVKASIVAAFFMNLWWDTRFNTLMLIMSIIFFFILVGITLLDTLFRTDPIPSF